MTWAISFLLGCLIIYLILRPIIKTTKIKNEAIEKYNKDLEEKNNELSTKIEKEQSELLEINGKVNSANAQVSSTMDMLEKLKEQQSLTLEAEYSKKISLEEQKYKQAQEEAKESYLDLLAECSADFVSQTNEYNLESEKIEKQLNILKSKMLAIIEEQKRQEKIKEESEFYKLQLSDIDKEEIKKLEEVATWLRDPDPLNKVIWKVYYEKPFSDLIGRLMTSGTHSGIYKITNIENGKSYIGQSVNLIDRLRNHIKAGLGIGGSNNKFYATLRELRPENFSYEILEECSSSELNEREKYWIDFYQSTTWGYNTTAGGSQNRNGE